MKYNKDKLAFTLIELLIVITITMIIIIWSSRVNFNFSTDKSRLESFKNKIVAQIETVRTNDLVWKGIWINLITPEKWEMNFSNTSSGEIEIFYSTDWNNSVSYNDMIIEDFYYIENVKCTNVSWSYIDEDSWIIVFEKWNYSLSGSCLGYSEIEINIWYKSIKDSIDFDTVNWLIKR